MKSAFARVKGYYRSCPLYLKISWMHCGIIFFVIVMLVVVISSIVSGLQIEQKTENYQKNLFAISEKFDMMFSNYERDARAIITNQQYQEALLKKESSKNEAVLHSMKIAIALADFHASYTKIQTIRFYDWVRQTAYDNLLVNLGDKSSPSWRRVSDFVELGKSYAWTDFVTAKPESAYVSLLHRVNNYEGEFVGALELVVSESQIHQMYSVFESGDTRFFLTDGQGQIISCTDKQRLGERLDEADFSGFISPEGNRGRIARFDGADCLVVSKAYEKLGCWLIGVTPRGKLVEGVSLLRLSIVLIGALGIVTAGFFVRWSAKKSTYPLEQIIDTIDRVSAGDYAVRVDTRAGNEFSKLGSQLNTMIDNTVAMMEHIRYQSEQERLYELNNIQMQLNPHFLYNSLETVCGIIETGDPRLAIRMINHISRFYRGVLSGGSAMVTLEQETRITRQYLEILRIRYRNGFDVDIDVPPEMENVLVPKMLLQPIVENAIVHGFDGHWENAKIGICARVGEKRLEVAVSDNGKGMTPLKSEGVLLRAPDKAYEGGGFGLRSIDQRIKLVFGEDYGLAVESAPGRGTTVRVLLPKGGEARCDRS